MNVLNVLSVCRTCFKVQKRQKKPQQIWHTSRWFSSASVSVCVSFYISCRHSIILLKYKEKSFEACFFSPYLIRVCPSHTQIFEMSHDFQRMKKPVQNHFDLFCVLFLFLLWQYFRQPIHRSLVFPVSLRLFTLMLRLNATFIRYSNPE